jgi:rhodanese-related sulfurtransferase
MTRVWQQNLFRFTMLATVAVVAVGAGCAKEPEPEATSPSITAASISAAALVARLGTADAPTVLDVRTLEEYSSGHVPGAINVPYDQIAARSGEFAAMKDSEIVVYCRSGKRAGMAEADLRAAGFSRVVDLEGHMQGWEAGDFPIE